MKKSIKLFAFLLILCAGLPPLVNAVSWSPIQEEREEKAAKGLMVKGDIVCLFQSGTSDVKKEIHKDDVLTVYRKNKEHQFTAVAKIKILSYVGEDYLKGEVIDGEVKAGDIAKKGDAASLIISSMDKCK